MQTTNRLADAMALVFPAIPVLPTNYQKSLFAALATPVPVEQCIQAMEIFYSAVKTGAVTGDDLTQAATVAANLGTVVAQWSLHGKGLRGAMITAAMLRATKDADAQAGDDPDIEYDKPPVIVQPPPAIDPPSASTKVDP